MGELDKCLIRGPLVRGQCRREPAGKVETYETSVGTLRPPYYTVSQIRSHFL